MLYTSVGDGQARAQAAVASYRQIPVPPTSQVSITLLSAPANRTLSPADDIPAFTSFLKLFCLIAQILVLNS